ncbi:MAG: hypothetical protein U0R68_06885 [Candidatus Nanopelagicales bacterium]
MTIVETPTVAPVAFETARGRRWAAAWLAVGPLMMIASFGLAAVIDRSTGGLDDFEAAKAEPGLAGLSSFFDLLTPPTMLAWGAVMFLVAHRWARRSSWTFLVANVLQLCGLAAVVGIELVTALLFIDGVPRATIDSVMDDKLTGTVPGIALMLMFMVTIPIGFIALGIALWATRWVPRWVPVVMWLTPFADMLTPDHPKWLHVALFVVLLAASLAVAGGILRDGAPGPAVAEHTS